MKNAIVIALAVSLAGCMSPEESVRRGREIQMERITFHKHETGLCFAALSYDRSMSITNIPCASGDTVFVR